jgi:hypothetical protein
VFILYHRYAASELGSAQSQVVLQSAADVLLQLSRLLVELEEALRDAQQHELAHHALPLLLLLVALYLLSPVLEQQPEEGDQVWADEPHFSAQLQQAHRFVFAAVVKDVGHQRKQQGALLPAGVGVQVADQLAQFRLGRHICPVVLLYEKYLLQQLRQQPHDFAPEGEVPEAGQQVVPLALLHQHGQGSGSAD